jgi:NhaP-type Na+/H+ or K+/H+ antiporter
VDEHTKILSGLAGVIVLGVVAQWVAARARVPAIIMLLGAGLLVGPAAQGMLGHKLLDPEHLLGPLLYPLVSLSVAVILFEGGLTLNVRELREVGGVLRNLVTIGAAATWVTTTLAARYVLGFAWPPALLLGAILVVTGPTVIGPLLRHVRPVGPVGAVLKWEGIVIDPVGATLALLVFDAIHVGAGGGGATVAAWAVVRALAQTVIFGTFVGAAAAGVLVLSFRRLWVADLLQVPATLAAVVAAFAASNLLQAESGLLAVTVMGVTLANQRLVPFRHILDFKESLSVLLVSVLFVLLGSRLEGDQVAAAVDWRTGGFLAVLFLVARPLCAAVSTWGSGLGWRERAFIGWMAPRGIVAAAVSSLFAVRLRGQYPEAVRLVPVTFAVVLSSVVVYGLTAARVARRLGLAGGPAAGGYLIAGASPLARLVARVLRDAGQRVMLVDTSRVNVAAATREGLEAAAESAVSERVLERVEATGITRLLALTPNEEVNTLAALHLARVFGRSQVYQLAPEERDGRAGDVTTAAAVVGAADRAKVSRELHGRLLFTPGVTYEVLAGFLAAGGVPERVAFTDGETFAAYRAARAGRLIPMFLITAAREWRVNTVDAPLEPAAGDTLISLVAPQPARGGLRDAGAEAKHENGGADEH